MIERKNLKNTMNRLQNRYQQEIVPQLKTELGFTSVMEVPRLVKIVVNSGISDAVSHPQAVAEMQQQMGLITGQQPVITRAHKSIAAFKLREGMPVGVKVTLRGKKMYDFLDKLINIELPRVRDFRGLSRTSFDRQANYSLGIKEQIVFPEIDYDLVKQIRGMDITLVTSTTNRQQALALLTALGLPFKKQGGKNHG